MTRREVLARARELLTKKNVPDLDWEAELLLRDTLKISRTELYAEPQLAVTPRQEAEFWAKIERRLEGEPAAYIIGRREFYGLDFWVDDSVLIPRPETELLVEKALELARTRQSPLIADIGTGSGAIAITLALNLPEATVYATDISQRALNTARCNCERHNILGRVRIYAGDLLEPLPVPVDMIVANLPYIATEDLPLVNTWGFEPKMALNGGQDGLDFIRRLCAQAGKLLKPGGSLLLEIGIGQKDKVVDLLRQLFPDATIAVSPDLRRIDRVVCLSLPKE